jgi:hypothetical protein
MRTKLLIMSAAALLAGTVMAAGQGMQHQGPAGAGQDNGAPPSGQMKTQQKGQKSDGQKSDQGSRTQTQGQKSPPSTNGQAPRGDEERDQGQNPRDRNQDHTQGQNQRGQEPQQDETKRQGQGPGKTSANFTTEQRTKIRETVLNGSNAPRANNVTFSLNVGTAVPRTVRIVEVPETLIEVHPEWRSYRYFVVNDEIIIVEPDTLKIVAVVTV